MHRIWAILMCKKSHAHKKLTVLSYCGVPGSPCLSKTGLILARIFFFKFFSSLSVCTHLERVTASWPVSRRGPEPRRFFGDPASLASDNILVPMVASLIGNQLSMALLNCLHNIVFFNMIQTLACSTCKKTTTSSLKKR